MWGGDRNDSGAAAIRECLVKECGLVLVDVGLYW